jgi:hypothetical protein
MIRKRKYRSGIRLFFIFFISFIITDSYCQLDNKAFYLPSSFQAEKDKCLYFSFSNLNFTKNNEYFNKIADGYTLFGYQVNSEVVFFPSENIGIRAGVFVWKDFGNNKYSGLAPTYSVSIRKDSLSFIFGKLDGSLKHRLIEPLYDFENILTDRLEDGIQVIYNHNLFYLDLWINWEHMLYRGEMEQEKVSVGFSGVVKILDRERFVLDIPVQIFGMHKGGQIDASPLPLKTVFNSAVGLSFQWNSENNSFFQGLRTDNYYTFYDDISFEKTDAFSNGHGTYLNLTFLTKYFDLMLSYWKGNKYISHHGGALYNSRSTTFKYPDFVDPNRELFIIRFLQEIRIMKNLYITARIEPLYDFNSGKIEFSHGLYINYKQNFLLKKSIRTP